ncbi:MAG: hypothetical protein CMM95_00670 [Rickettsiales bacterium]|nr:hypothetical protein [Rickettsiales bacterium]
MKLNQIFLFVFFVFSFDYLKSKEKMYSVTELSNLYVEPNIESPIIYPIDLGKELIIKKKNDKWFSVLDEQTGLVGWVQKEFLSDNQPEENLKKKDYKSSFKAFRGRVLEMSASIKDAISIETFLDVKHLGGAAAVVIAHNEWFQGRRHANQAFQVYDMWKNQNQSPSFLSFRNESDVEQFIILSGPHRPRYLKSSK